MNKKGYTLIEVLITITITLSIAYGVITIPTGIMQEYKDYEALVDRTHELNIIRSSLVQDLKEVAVKEIDSDTLQIGGSIYKFTNDGLKRETAGTVIELSDKTFFFELDGELLHIYNDEDSFKYSVSNSFDMGGELNE